MVTDHQVAVLGGGISGSLTACLLADAGIDVMLVERQDELVDGASRWNDGKIHLGYTFTAMPSLATAALMQEGAGTFLPILERVLGGPLPADACGEPVIYLVDRRSMVDPETLWARAQAVDRLLRESAERLPGLRAYAGSGASLERIAPDRAGERTGQGEVIAAWRTSEVHLAPRTIAQRLRDAVRARGITVLKASVTGVEPTGDPWRVLTAGGSPITTQVVVNCTWEERTLIDRGVQSGPGLAPVSIRFKWALFGEGAWTVRGLEPSTRIVGRYGDIVAYPNGDAYLGWYPAGLAARSDDGTPPLVAPPDSAAVTQATLQGLGLPASMLEDPGATWQVRGGFVVAHGYGDIDRIDSPLHRRDRPGVVELRPGYLSVDTGKYTLGPLMARRASEAALAYLRGRATR